jgi:aspartate-semialdehyde dehydrogenase
VAKGTRTFSVFSPGGMAVTSLALALRRHDLQRLVATLYWPVSEAGREGIEELETQTTQLLTFQEVGHRVFGTQTAFNLLTRYGEESRQDLRARLLEIRAEVSAAMGDAAEDAKISLNVIHSPVFYGMAFSACADLSAPVEREAIEESCRDAGFVMQARGEPAPSNVSVTGENSLYLGEPVKDAAREGSWWFWGACDNLRVPAWSGVKLAEWLTT